MNRTSVIIGNEFRRVKSNLIELLGTYIGAWLRIAWRLINSENFRIGPTLSED
jgi:hypothetical protein